MAGQKPLVTWRAIVQVSNVPEITPDELLKIADSVPGSISHVRGHPGWSLFLDWRFEAVSLGAAMAVASATWRHAVGLVSGASDPQCTDFRVLRVFPSKKEKRS